MIIFRHKNFRKHFKSRILQNKKLVIKFQERLDQFIENPQNPILKDHQLTGDIRVCYKIYGITIELYDIGSHNQVY